MVRNFVLILTIAIGLLSGCSESGLSTSPGGARRIDTPVGMIEYLEGRNLPAMESVRVWENGYGPGLIITTKHYDIYTTLLEPLMLSLVPGFVESAYLGYQDQLAEPVETTGRFKIYLFAQRSQWGDFTKSFAGPQANMYRKIKAGAYFLNGVCVAYNIGRERTFSVLGHEGWHQFHHGHFKFRLPSWLDEGIATLFENSTENGGLFSFEPGRNVYRLGALKKTLIKGRMIPLKELVAINPGEVLATNQSDAVAAFYGQAYALVRFMREESYGKWLRNYRQLLLDGIRGNWPISAGDKTIAADRSIPLTVWWNRRVGPQLFQYYISEDFDQIEQDYLIFCRKIVYHVHFKK